jgi:hypothetical protein
MGGAVTVSSINYDFGGGGDFPVAYKLEVATAGTYTQVAMGAGATGVNKIAITPQSVRTFRITQTGTTGTNWWSIYNISVSP